MILAHMRRTYVRIIHNDVHTHNACVIRAAECLNLLNLMRYTYNIHTHTRARAIVNIRDRFRVRLGECAFFSQLFSPIHSVPLRNDWFLLLGMFSLLFVSLPACTVCKCSAAATNVIQPFSPYDMFLFTFVSFNLLSSARHGPLRLRSQGCLSFWVFHRNLLHLRGNFLRFTPSHETIAFHFLGYNIQPFGMQSDKRDKSNFIEASNLLLPFV